MIRHTCTVINISLCASNPYGYNVAEHKRIWPLYVLRNHGLVAAMKQTDQMKAGKPKVFVRFVN